MASRTVVLWTSVACQGLEKNTNATHLQLSLHGHGDIPQKLLQYAWTHWEDPVDAIKHQARIVFEKLLKCHLLATGEKPDDSAWLHQLMDSLLDMGWDMKGKYGPLCGLIEHITTTKLLQTSSTLPQDVLQASKEQLLVSYANELLEKLFVNHKKELMEATPGGGESATLWPKTWIDPTLDILCTGTPRHKIHIIEYTIPRLLKCSPESMKYITEKLIRCVGGNYLGALVTCLKRAKMMGILKKSQNTNSQMWNDVVPMTTIKQALSHPDEQVLTL